jgi:hypothetical protein
VIPLRVAGIALFVAALAALPLPMFGFDGSSVPAARYWQLGLVCLQIIAAEGGQGMVGAFAGLLLGHAVVYTTGIALAAAIVTRTLLRRVPLRGRDHILVISVTLLIALGIFARLYATQFHHSSAHAQLLELYR